jgi:hypothetical protein
LRIGFAWLIVYRSWIVTNAAMEFAVNASGLMTPAIAARASAAGNVGMVVGEIVSAGS